MQGEALDSTSVIYGTVCWSWQVVLPWFETAAAESTAAAGTFVVGDIESGRRY